MDVCLTPELEQMVKSKVQSGLFDNVSDVVCEALRLMIQHDAENDWLNREAALGFAQLDAGQTVRVTTKEEFLAIARGEAG